MTKPTDRQIEAAKSSVVIVSMHEKGFPQADFYPDANGWDEGDWEGAIPESFFTMKRGDTLEMAKRRAKMKWPQAEIVVS